MTTTTLQGRPQPVWNFSQFAHLVPPVGYIRDYLEYAIQCTDAPPLYHILAASAITSAAVAPYLDLVFEGEVHPLHMFILIVGDSSESRKTSAIKRAVRTAEPVFSRVASCGDRLWWPTASSSEGITDELAKEPNRLMLLSEWTDMHRTASQASYWKHASEFFNLVYDATAMHRIKAKGNLIKIVRPRVSILSASTPSLVASATSSVDWLGGKLARYLIGCMTRPPGMEMEAAVERPDLVATLQGRLSQLVNARPPGARPGSGDATLAPEAWDAMRAWARDPWWTDLKARAPGHLKPAFGRVNEHLFRLSAIYEASMSYPFQVRVGLDAMQAAIALIEVCYDSMIRTFPTLADDDTSALQRVAAVLASTGTEGIPRSELLKRTRVTAKQLNECLATLVEREELRSENVWTNGKGGLRYFHTLPG